MLFLCCWIKAIDSKYNNTNISKSFIEPESRGETSFNCSRNHQGGYCNVSGDWGGTIKWLLPRSWCCMSVFLWGEGGSWSSITAEKTLSLFLLEHLNLPDTSNKWECAEALLCLPSTHRQVKFRVKQLLSRIITLFPPRWADKDVTSRNKRKDQRFLRWTFWLKLYSKAWVHAAKCHPWYVLLNMIGWKAFCKQPLFIPKHSLQYFTYSPQAQVEY